MQVEIRIVVGVNHMEHANIIASDIRKVIGTRSTIFYIAKPEYAKVSVSQLWEADPNRPRTALDEANEKRLKEQADDSIKY